MSYGGFQGLLQYVCGGTPSTGARQLRMLYYVKSTVKGDDAPAQGPALRALRWSVVGIGLTSERLQLSMVLRTETMPITSLHTKFAKWIS